MDGQSRLAKYIHERRHIIEGSLIDDAIDTLDELDEIDAPEDYDVEWPILPSKFYDGDGELVFERSD